MSTEPEGDLKNELEVSKNVIRVLMKDLLEAENKIKDLEAAAASHIVEHTPEEATGRNSASRPSTRIDDNNHSQSEPQAWSNVKAEFQDFDISSADAIIEQLQAQCNQLLEQRTSLQELADQSQDNLHRAKKYKEKNKSLKQEMDAKSIEYQKSGPKLDSLRDTITSYIQMSDRLQKQIRFDPKTFMEMKHNIQAQYHKEETLKSPNDLHESMKSKQVQQFLTPDLSPLRLHDDDETMWLHPSGSYILFLEPTYVYNPDDMNAKSHSYSLVPKEWGCYTDLFCFHTQESVWKYYGIFAYAGSKMVTFQQAREELLFSEETIELVRRRSGASEHDWMDRMYREGTFKILCTGLKRTGFNYQLPIALDKQSRTAKAVPIPEQSRRGHLKRKNDSDKDKDAKRDKK